MKTPEVIVTRRRMFRDSSYLPSGEQIISETTQTMTSVMTIAALKKSIKRSVIKNMTETTRFEFDFFIERALRGESISWSPYTPTSITWDDWRLSSIISKN